MRRVVWLPLVVALGASAGCPAKPSAGHPAPPDAVSPASEPPAPVEHPAPDPTPPEPPPDPAGPTGPAGPPLPSVPNPDDGVPQTNRAPDRTIRVGAISLPVWVADSNAERMLGLMHVRHLPDDRGMLFVYPDAARRAFWMKNTYVPLSLAYVAADGRIDQILDMEPLTRSSHPSRTAVRFVLEVRKGWFGAKGVGVGDRLDGILDLVGY